MIHSEGEAQARQEVGPAEAAPQEQTLHDFVANLLNDATARAAFAQDPARALESSGLDDITAEDVQDVVPLVMDYGQLPGRDALVDPADAVGGLQGAIEQLKGVADAALGERAHLAGTTDLRSDLGELAAGGAADLDAVSGVARWTGERTSGEGAARFDSESFDLAAHAENAVGTISGVGGLRDGGADGSFAADTLLAEGAGAVEGGLDGVSGDALVRSDYADLAAFGDGGADGLDAGVAARNDLVGAEGTTSVSADELRLDGSLTTPFGSYGAELTGNPSELSLPELSTTDDLVDGLDADTLSRGGEAAASTVATYVASGGAALEGVARSVTEDLPVDAPQGLPMDDLPVDVPVAAPLDLADQPDIDDEALSGARSDEPAPADEPAAAGDPLQIADLSTDLPNVAGGLYDTVSQVHGELNSVPGQLGFAVPDESPEMPELPIVNPEPEAEDAVNRIGEGADVVTDTVSDSPVGAIAETGQDLLDSAPGVSDLDLGH